MKTKKYLFRGPVQSGVTFGRGKNARDVQLIPGRTCELDPESRWVKSSIAKGHLVLIADSFPKEPQREDKDTQLTPASNVESKALAEGNKPAGAGSDKSPQGEGPAGSSDTPQGVSSGLATFGEASNKNKRKG